MNSDIAPERGSSRMAIPDGTGKIHLVELGLLRRTAAALERDGVDIAGMRADKAAQMVLNRILLSRGELPH